MSVELKDICPEFNGLETAAFKRKIYESCLLMTLDHYTNISSWYSENKFPANKYYTSKDFVKDMKPNKKILVIIRIKCLILGCECCSFCPFSTIYYFIIWIL